jgi:uncharacterized protein YerC
MKKAIITRFEGNYKTFFDKYLPEIKKLGGDEYQAACPFPNHEDANPSFNFSNQTGRYYCHGCGKKGDIFHFHGKINGLDTRRDFGKILRGITSDFGIQVEQQKARIINTYDYVDQVGKLLFQVCRMEPKSFRQRRPNGKGGWIWNLNGVDSVLYRLPEIIKAGEILICEGEKDADILNDLGFTATTNPMGAKKWQHQYTDALKGKYIILIPDNDTEGREHMTRVGAALKGVAAGLKWIDLPGLPSKGDVSDFIATFRDTAEATESLSVLIDQAPIYEPPKTATIEDIILQADQFYSLDYPERQELIFPWLKEDSINLVSGWRGCGKTWFAMGILDAVTTGKGFGPWEPNKRVPCLFLDGEMAVQDDKERIEALQLNSDRENPLYIYCDGYANQCGLPRANLLNENWRQTIKRFLLTRKVKLWVVDNLASLASGLDENSKRDWDPINQWLLELRFAGISTIMLHHVNKEGGQRGTSAREDNLDISITLKNPHDYTPEDGARFIVHFAKARVQTKYLNLISDTEFKLQSIDGVQVWTHEGVKASNEREVIRMLDDGMTYRDIAKDLNISVGVITKIKKRAIENGYLTEKGKLTQTGFTHISA